MTKLWDLPFVRQCFDTQGITCSRLPVAEEALQILADQHIDLVISDHMLQGTTGTQVAASMKRIRPDIPILILSGFTEAPEGMEFADFFLSKLEPPPVLLATVDNLLTQRRSLLDGTKLVGTIQQSGTGVKDKIPVRQISACTRT